MLLEGKVALVSGASRGIGRATALACAAHGADVVMFARSEALHRVADEVKALGRSVVAMTGDATDEAFCKKVVLACRSTFGRLDCLVNNAAVISQGLVGMTSVAAVRALLETNVSAPIQLTQYAVRLLEKGRGPSIVNVASIAGTKGMEGVSAYAASKAAMVGFTLAAAKELAPRGIRVNAVAPGFIDTDMTRSMPADWFDKRMASIGVGRIGTPEDVANAVVLLASDLAGYVTGQVLGVDGGMVA
jgi:3-oxoacyl-[acyl-carrier protein] reductase